MTEDIAAYVGVDWASATHYVYALDAQGAKLGHRSKPITVADGVTEACVAHCELILQRLRLVMQQMKAAMKQLERLCSAVAELPPAIGVAPNTQAGPEILRSMPGVGTIVLGAFLSEAHDAVARRDAHALRGLSGARHEAQR